VTAREASLGELTDSVKTLTAQNTHFTDSVKSLTTQNAELRAALA
jgi:hypothetical protein